jgi:phosphatidate cytidylyltransferase
LPVSLAARKMGHTDFLSRFFVWLAIIPAFLSASYFGAWLFFILLTGCCMAACLELVWLKQNPSYSIGQYAIALSMSLPWLLWAQVDGQFPWQYVLFAITVPMLLCFFKRGSIGSRWHLVCLSLVLGTSLSFWVLLQKMPGGFRFVLFAFTVVVITDIMAFLSGKMLSGLRLFPRLSPNKTLAGLIGGGLSAVLVSYIFWFAIPEFNFLNITAAGLLLAVSGSAGDLAASVIKRYHGVKDFSRMLGPMGGMLDRLDSMLGSGWVFFVYIQAFV